MRARSVLVTIVGATAATSLVASCLSAPVGRAQSWPPAAIDVVAIATGDLDGDGSADLIVVSAGAADAGGGVYFLSGAHDVDLATAQPAATFTHYVPLAITAPASATVQTFNGTKTAVVAYAANGVAEVRAFTGATLTAAGDDVTTNSLGSGDQIWFQSVAFPGARQHLLVGEGNTIVHYDLGSAFGSAMPIPAPGSAAVWTSPRAAATYTSGADTVLAISTTTEIDEATLPTSAGAQFAFAKTSAWGATLIGQSAGTLDSTTLVGGVVAEMTSQLCVADPTHGSGSGSDVTACTSGTTTAIATGPDDAVTTLIGNVVAGMAGAVVVVGDGSGATIYGFPGLSYAEAVGSGSAALSVPAPGPVPHTVLALPNALAVPVSAGIFVMSSTGDNECRAFGSGAGSAGTLACAAN